MEAAGGPRSPPAAVPATPSPAAPTTQPEQPQTSPTPQPTTTSTPGGPINLFEAAAQRAAAARSGGTIRPAAPNAGATPAVGAGAGAGGPGGLTAGMGANLEALRNNPNFLQLRNIVQSNPQLLEPIIQNIAQGNPQFAQLITQNPEAFLQLLAEGGEGGEGGGALPPGAIQVTPEEAEAIGRVCFFCEGANGSWKHWDFRGIWLFKLILPVIRMKRSLPIIYLNMDLKMTMTTKHLRHNLLVSSLK